MTRFNLKPPEFQTPQIRESYMRHFIERSSFGKNPSLSPYPNANIRY